jgi:hypothetical protein
VLYDKNILVQAFVHRYESLGLEQVEKLYKMASSYYDTVTKDQFRSSCSLDPKAIKFYLDSV